MFCPVRYIRLWYSSTGVCDSSDMACSSTRAVFVHVRRLLHAACCLGDGLSYNSLLPAQEGIEIVVADADDPLRQPKRSKFARLDEPKHLTVRNVQMCGSLCDGQKRPSWRTPLFVVQWEPRYWTPPPLSTSDTDDLYD